MEHWWGVEKEGVRIKERNELGRNRGENNVMSKTDKAK